MTSRGNELKSIGTIQPGSVFNVPMKAIYTPTCELFFSVPQYSVTNTPFIWKDLQSNVNQTQILLCHPNDEVELGHGEPFVIKVMLISNNFPIFIFLIADCWKSRTGVQRE